MRLTLFSVALVWLCVQYANADSAVCATTMKLYNCDECVDPAHECVKCNSGYVLNAGKDGCTKCTANCVNCTLSGSTTACVTCESNYFLKSDKTCSPCSAISSCIKCHGDNATATKDQAVCEECDSKNYLANKKCEACGSGCMKCSASGCSECDSNTKGISYKEGKECASCSNCYKCEKGDSTTDVKCTNCTLGYYIGSDGVCAKCDDSNCDHCETNNKAKCMANSCKKHYYVDSSSTCKECGSKCDKCEDKTVSTLCTTCEEEYGPKVATDISCDKCGDGSNCKTCSLAEAKADGQCSSCDTGYAQDGTTKKCMSCSGAVTNCKTCSSTGGTVTCLTCDTGYELGDKTCHKCPDKCKTGSCVYNNTHDPVAYCTDCDTATSRYALDAKDECTTDCDIKNCVDCEFNATAGANGETQCKCVGLDAYVPVIDNANEFTTRGWCAGDIFACKAGNYYDDTGTVPACITCGVTGCNSCNDTNQVCLNCETPAYAKVVATDGTCKKCTDVHAQCDACTYSNSGSGTLTCDSCADGYYLDGNTCTACLSKCKICSSATTCTTCNDGTEKASNSKACLDCTSPCKTCHGTATSADATKAKCKTCDDGYYLPSGGDACVICMDHCGMCSKADDCSNCNDYYGWSSNSKKCEACAANCTDCSYDSSAGHMICSTCQSGYTSNDKVCGKCPDHCDHCKSIDGTMSCEECDDAYFKDGNLCTKCITDCEECSDATTCSAHKCKAGKSLSLDKKSCPGCATATGVLNCNNCTDATLLVNATCMGCSSGFDIKDDHSECLANSKFGTTCAMSADLAPNCTKCQDKAGYKWVDNKCQVKCLQCGADLLGATSLTPLEQGNTCNVQGISLTTAGYSSVYCPWKCVNSVLDKNKVVTAYSGCMPWVFDKECGTHPSVDNSSASIECCDSEHCNDMHLTPGSGNGAAFVVINAWLLGAMVTLVTSHM